MAKSTGGEHHVRIPAHGSGQVASPEKLLNGFVRVVAFLERVGNALGTLAFTWATVILLGGYPTVLLPKHDFLFVTIIVFLEIRMFNRSNRLDYQLFFQSKGAVRPLGWNGLTVIVYLSSILVYALVDPLNVWFNIGVPVRITVFVVLLLLVPAVRGMIRSSGVLNLVCKPVRCAISLLSPLVAITLLVPLLVESTHHHQPGHIRVMWIVFALLFLTMLLLTISRLPFPRIIKVEEHVLGTKQVFWRRLIINICMFVELVMLVLVSDDPARAGLITYEVFALMLVSFGNIQIPAAVARIVLSLLRLKAQDYYGDSNREDPTKKNLASSLIIFYAMVLGQGILYLVACLLEIFSFIPRRILAYRGGFRLQSVSSYYAYALEKCMENDVLTQKNISLSSFAMDSINSDSPKRQLHGIKMMHNLLKMEPTRTQLVWKLKASTNTMARLIEMLDWTSPEHATARLFAAKVTAELATSIRVQTVPGTIQVVSGLLVCCNQKKRGNPLLHINYFGLEKVQDSVLNTDENQEETVVSVSDSGCLLETQDRSTQQVGTAEQSSRMLKCCQWMSKLWSGPQEEPLTDQDHLPTLGILILDGLAHCDEGNCVEISRASGLIPKIIGFTRYNRSSTTCTDAQWQVLLKSSLRFLQSLTSVEGEIGITLRHKVSQNPFLLRNLADIFSTSSSQELRTLVAGILRNLAIDESARQAIGRIQVIITWLMGLFLSPDTPSSTDHDPLLREVAGQALAILGIGSVNNCVAMLRETGYEFIKELTSMIHIDRYRCVAASLLRNICVHARPELKEEDLKELSYSLRQVLERILVADGAELEIFIGLSSEMCRVIPGEFAQELEDGHIKDRFVKRLVDALNANVEPDAQCPGIRRVMLEHAINMMELDARYASCFNHRRMAEALCVVGRDGLGV